MVDYGEGMGKGLRSADGGQDNGSRTSVSPLVFSIQLRLLHSIDEGGNETAAGAAAD